jgi:hypothetical protein
VIIVAKGVGGVPAFRGDQGLLLVGGSQRTQIIDGLAAILRRWPSALLLRLWWPPATKQGVGTARGGSWLFLHLVRGQPTSTAGSLARWALAGLKTPRRPTWEWRGLERGSSTSTARLQLRSMSTYQRWVSMPRRTPILPNPRTLLRASVFLCKWQLKAPRHGGRGGGRIEAQAARLPSGSGCDGRRR